MKFSTLKRAELTAFSVSPKGKIIGSTKAHVETKRINHRWAVEERNEVYCPTSEGRRLVDVHLMECTEFIKNARYKKSDTSRHIAPSRRSWK